MTDKEMQKLKRTDLLELLISQMKENELLKQQLNHAQAELESRKVLIEQSGSLAEAALKLNGVFEAADAACVQYKINLEQTIKCQVEEECRLMLEQTRKQCKRLEDETYKKCVTALEAAKKESHRYWKEATERVKSEAVKQDEFKSWRQMEGSQ